MVSYSKDVLNFLRENRDLINDKKFDGLYFYAQSTLGFWSIPQITEILLKIPNFNPLKYMEHIPKDYLRDSEIIDKIFIPTNIKSIEDNAFRNTKNIKTIVLPQSVEYLGRDVFLDSHVERAALQLSKIPVLPNGTFAFCGNLKELSIPNTLYKIDQSCFSADVKNLKHIIYNGTMIDFEKITWNSLPNCEFEVHCHDGYLLMDGRGGQPW